jgi:NADPH-dependent curcumin reductase
VTQGGADVARVNRQILLKSRPEGAPSLDNFVLKQGSVPEPGDGEVLMRTLWLSLDPYMRGSITAKGPVEPQPV